MSRIGPMPENYRRPHPNVYPYCICGHRKFVHSLKHGGCYYRGCGCVKYKPSKCIVILSLKGGKNKHGNRTKRREE